MSSILRFGGRLSCRCTPSAVNRRLLLGRVVRARPYIASCSLVGHRAEVVSPAEPGSLAIPFPDRCNDDICRPNALIQSGGKQKHENDQGGNQSGGGSGSGWDGSGGNHHNNNRNNMVYLSCLLAAITGVYITSHTDEDEIIERDITWGELHDKVREGLVDRIVISNDSTTAHVYLKQDTGDRDARIASEEDEDSRSESGGWDDMQNDENDKESLTEGTLIQFGEGGSAEEETKPETPSKEMRRSSRHVHYGNRPEVYNTKRSVVFKMPIDHSFETKLEQAQYGMNMEPSQFVSVLYALEAPASPILTAAARLALIGIVATMVRIVTRRQGGGFGSAPSGFSDIMYQLGRSNAKKFCSKDVSVTFRDVAGCGEAKREIMEFVDFLQDASRFSRLGAKIPKGALLTGPPGTGKTLLAKAVAGEAGVPFYSASGSDFVEMFVGVGPSRIRDLFKEARENAPCIVFIDEIDAIGRKRGGEGGFSSGGDERENTLNQLLVEMDGFQPSSGVVVLAGTNRMDILDEALTRPGRFDRRILVDKPDLQGRKDVFLVHLKGIALDGKAEDIAFKLAGLTPGFSGADISNLCNEAAIVAARRNADAVCKADFEKATERIIGGLESTKIMSTEEKRIVAQHEAGHAVAAWFLEHADPLLKVSIIPRSSGALGYSHYLPNDVFLRTYDQMMDSICVALAGRAAEDLFFGEVTTGASDDLKNVTESVYGIIQAYGMTSCLGQLSYAPDNQQGERRYSDATASAMDSEARRIVDGAYQRTLALMSEKKDQIEAVASLLLERETLTHDDFQRILGGFPHNTNSAYDEYMDAKRKEEQDVKARTSARPGGDAGDCVPGLAFYRET